MSVVSKRNAEAEATQPAMLDSTVAEAYLKLVAARGIEFLFANAGTDFAPLIEAYAKLATNGAALPKAVTVPHENVAISMALGHWLVSRRMQAVMVHVNVGTANAICGLLNAARANIPILFTAGRTPITESGMEGGRSIHIHWMQEMFDQAGMVREAVKWDYELRNGTQLETVVDRAMGIAESEPKGPVYLTLPREVLASKTDNTEFSNPARHGVNSVPYPDPAATEQATEMLAAAKAPLIITSTLGYEADGVSALSALAERLAIPVVQFIPRCMSLPSSHPMHVGYDPAPWLREADLVIVADALVPWIPNRMKPQKHAKIIQLGIDPLYQRVPIRGFECDLAISGRTSASLRMIDTLSASLPEKTEKAISERRAAASEFRRKAHEDRMRTIERVRHLTPIHPAWFTHCIDMVKDEETIVIREAPQLALPYLSFEQEASFFAAGAAGGLGWGLGAAVGAKLAASDKLVMAIEGDGSYMFSEPVSAHYVAMEQDAPFLTVIFNNQKWNEVQASTRDLYPNGYAAQANSMEPLTWFDKKLQLHKTVEVTGGYGERVTEPAELPDALRRVMRIVRENRQQAVLDVVCSD